MSGRILVHSPSDVRRARLRTVLETGYFDVVEAASSEQAIAVAEARRPALAILDAGGDGFALCRALKMVGGQGAPSVMITHDPERRPSPADRLAAETAGADCVEAPRHERVLLARARCLIRLKTMADELDRRRETTRELGFADVQPKPDPTRRGRVLLVGPDRPETRAFGAALARRLDAVYDFAETGFAALRIAAGSPPDALLVLDPAALPATPAASTVSPCAQATEHDPAASSLEDPLDMIAAFAAREETRRAAILFLSAEGASDASSRRLAAALDAGACDHAPWADPAEISARLRVHLGRKRRADGLRAALDDGLRQAARDGLTGLYDRRYFERHAERLFADQAARPLAAMIFDIDRFKAVNDRHGHAAGDRVLATFAARLRSILRSGDLICRFGGEEFAVLSPGSTLVEAEAAANRVREAIARAAIPIAPDEEVSITVSVGVASARREDKLVADLIARADAALYDAKRGGRNRVRRVAA